MSIYGQDTGYWEDTVKADTEMYSRFTDKTDPGKKLNTYMSERDSFKYGDVDPVLQHQLDENVRHEQKMEMLRQQFVSKQDKYYDKISRIKF